MIFKRAVAKLRAQDWAAITIELVIVTLGVLIALAAQQWADERSERNKVEETRAALRDELAEHYGYAVEFRTVYPCLQAQLNRLRDRVLSSGPVLAPAPISKDDNFHYVLRLPSKAYPTDAWEAAHNDGTLQHLDPSFRRLLAGHYGSLPEISAMNSANDASEEGLVALTHALPLDPMVRYAIIKEIEQLRGRLEYLDYDNGQLIDTLQQSKMLPPAQEARAVTQRYGTYQFCKTQGLPMRSFNEAMKAIPG
jgi:hypothetical protein